MINSENATIPQDISVHLWRQRRVVLDRSIQPADPKFMLLYVVEGHALCQRYRSIEQANLVAIPNGLSHEDALAQYAKWRSMTSTIAIAKEAGQDIDEPPPPRKTCPSCEGQGTWYDAVNKLSYGVTSEGPNIREVCPACRGAGYVEDLL